MRLANPLPALYPLYDAALNSMERRFKGVESNAWAPRSSAMERGRNGCYKQFCPNVCNGRDRGLSLNRHEVKLNLWSWKRADLLTERETAVLQFFSAIVSVQREIHQLVPCMNYGDAVGNHALELRDIFRSWDMPSEIYTEVWSSEFKEGFLLYSEHRYVTSPGNILIYHHCAGDTEIQKYFAQSRDKKILIYHNITPAHFFSGFNSVQEARSRSGRSELITLANAVDLAIADSEYNAVELRNYGFRNVTVIPISCNYSKFLMTPPSEHLVDFYDDGLTNILFVGRVVPNKKQEDLIRIFSLYQREMNPNSRLFLVGTWSGMESYLSVLTEEVRIQGAKHVVLTGSVRFEELLGYYRIADAFLCMSEHEGFCIPLLESMFFEVPVIAYRCAAVPETLGDCGILVDEKDPAAVAPILDRLANDAEFRRGVVSKQSRRLGYYSVERVSKMLRESILEGEGF